MHNRKKALLISDAFPPIGGSGSLRIVKLIKYLYRENILDISVVKPFYMYSESPYNNLFNEIPQDVKIYNLGNNFLYKFYGVSSDIYSLKPIQKKHTHSDILFTIKRFLKTCIRYFMPFDKYLILLLPFIIHIKKIKKKPDIIIASSPSNTMLLFGVVGKLLMGSKLIIDFRDGWIIRPNMPKKFIFWKIIECLLEKIFVKFADSVVTVTLPLVKYFKKIKHQNVYYIPNGFDPEDFPDIDTTNNLQNVNKLDKIKIIYTGGLPSHRHLGTFLKVVKNERLIKEKIVLDIWGSLDIKYIELIQEYGLNSVVHYKGKFSHDKMYNILKEYNWTLLIGQVGKGAETNFSSKIFEYIAAEKPIIGLAPPSAARELIKSYNIGICAHPYNYKEIKSVLLSIINKKVIIQYNNFQKLKNKYNKERLFEKYFKLIVENTK